MKALPPRRGLEEAATRAALAAVVVLALLGASAVSRAAASGPLALERLRNGDIGGLLGVEAAVGGQRGRWLLDTGSSEHLIAERLADRLDLAPGETVTLRTPLGRQRGRRVRLPLLRLGHWTQSAVSAVRVDLEPLVGALGVPIDGVLGAPLLAGHVLRIDLARQTLGVGNGPAAACPASRRVRLDRHRGMPLLTIDSAAGRGQSHLFDTGNPGALVRLATDDDAGDAGIAVNLPGTAAPLRLSLLPEVRVGALRREQVPLTRLPGTALREALPAAIVGSAGLALFDGAVLTVDLDAHQLCIDALPAHAALPGGFGLLLAPGPLAPRLSGVLPGSPAAQAGLQASDEIVGLDGRPAPQAVAALWQAIAARDAIELEVRRDGATRRVTLARAWFLPRFAPSSPGTRLPDR